MRITRTILVAGAVLLAGCQDKDAGIMGPHASAPKPPALRQNISSIVAPGQYWRDNDTLWVYSTVPELGIGSGQGEPDKLQPIANAGMRIVRMDLAWDSTMEDTPYHYTPAFYGFRWAVDNALAKGLTPLVLVHWYHGRPGPPGLGNDLGEFNRRYAAYLAEAARAFPEVRFWQIWNEMDGGYWAQHWAPWDNATQQFPRREQGRRYAETLKAVYPAIKAANPNAWVIVGGLTGTERMDPVVGGHAVNPATSWEFLNGMYDNNAAPFFDFMAVHSYGPHPTGGTAGDGTVDTDGNSIMAVVRNREGRSGRPLWLTEFGKEGPDAVQQAWWQGALDVIQRPGSPYTKAIGFTMYATDGDYGLGIFRSDYTTPRPTYTYLQGRGFNTPIFNAPVETTDVTVHSPDEGPVGYNYTRNGDHVVVHQVTVDKLVPTKVRFAPIVHRLFSQGLLDHMYGDDPNEGAAAGYVLEGRNYFQLRREQIGSRVPLYRCFVGAHHFVSTDFYCEAGVAAEGFMGFIASTQEPGTIPLYRVRSSYNGDRLSTIDYQEYQGQIAVGAIGEGITGYVWP